MPSTAEYLAAQPDIFGAMKQGNDYVNSIYDKAASMQAGQQFGSGDYSGASTTLANRGNIQGASQVHDYAVQQFQTQHAYIARAVPVFQQIYAQASQNGANPQAGAAALANAFDHIAPELKQIGATDEGLMQIRQALQSDPVNTLQSLSTLAAKQPEYHKTGDTTGVIIDKATGQIISHINGDKFITQQPGSAVLQVGGDGAPSGAAQPGAAPVSPQGGAPNSGPPPQGDRSQYFGSILGAPVTITSGDRTAGHNAAVGGVPDSAHLTPGLADDIVPQGMSTKDAAVRLAANFQQQGVPFDQIIDEGNHVHVSFAPSARGQVMEKSANGYSHLPVAASAPQAQPQGGNPNARVVSPATPVWHKPTAQEAQDFPGASAMNVNGEPKYPPATAAAANAPQDAVDLAAQTFLRTGTMPSGTRNAALSIRVLTRAAEIAKAQGVSVNDIVGDQAARKATSAALGAQAKLQAQIKTYINTFDQNVESLRAAVPAGAATSAPIINRWIQAGRKEVQGDPAVTRLNTWMIAVRDEYAKILSGASGSAGITDASRTEANGIIANIDTPQQMYAALDVMRLESRHRLQSGQDTINELNAALRTGTGAKPQAQPGQKPGQKKIGRFIVTPG